MSSNCNSASLNVYVPSAQNAWDAKKVNHLFKRIAYGVSASDTEQALLESPATLVDRLIDEALAKPLMRKPSWADDFDPEEPLANGPRLEWKVTFLNTMLKNGFRDRLSFFWSNHFVTGIPGYGCASYMYRYTKALQTHALGNFKTFIHEIGLESAMLLYLNGNQNTKNRPNENYARELYELFALGEGNGYTQTDIEETARALTGYNKRDTRCSPLYFVENNFDDGEKTIFGRTGNWGYDDVITILFEERGNQIARFIVEKLYRFFVHPELPENPAVINALAATFESSGFEITPVLRQLFKSEHFFNGDAMDVIIKSPVDLFLSFYGDTAFTVPDDDYMANIFRWSRNANQEVLIPPNVAGWQRDKDWISSPTLIARWTYVDRIIRDQFKANEEQFRSLALSITGPSNDVVYVSNTIVNKFLPEKLLTEQDYEIALDVFKSDSVPENYYEDGSWNLDDEAVPKQVCLLLSHIVKQPEFQLK
ncbi:DUF1800 domain-containing protein [Maribacter sp. 2-571]|uniref:DUF1800 domain-containing protein n=1 Tax=Maribacter sp. 2-571 TaxID=3417569 RepID=UPI003D3439C6